jgi:hypothetical protein
LKLWALMANKSTQKQWKTRVETPSAPSSAPSTFSLQVAAFRRQGSGKSRPLPLHGRGRAMP